MVELALKFFGYSKIPLEIVQLAEMTKHLILNNEKEDALKGISTLIRFLRPCRL